MKSFNIGTVVCLKSGGPRMTVCSVSDDGNVVSCLWFDDDDRLHDGHFHVDSLEIKLT